MHNMKEYLHTFKADLREQSRASIVLFIAIVLLSRIKSFPRNLSSRSSKNSLSVSILETRFSILETRFSIFETRFSKLKPWNSTLDSWFLKTLRIENRVSSGKGNKAPSDFWTALRLPASKFLPAICTDYSCLYYCLNKTSSIYYFYWDNN